MNIQVAFLVVALAGSEGSPADSSRLFGGQPTALNEIVAAIREAPRVESFLVTCLIRVTRETSAAWHDSIPKIGHCPVLNQGPAVEDAARSTLASLVQRASRDSCGVARKCLFDGRFAFRFHDRVPPLDLLISNECTSWIFMRGEKAILSEAGLTGYTDCIRDSLRLVLKAVFENTKRESKGD